MSFEFGVLNFGVLLIASYQIAYVTEEVKDLNNVWSFILMIGTHLGAYACLAWGIFSLVQSIRGL